MRGTVEHSVGLGALRSAISVILLAVALMLASAGGAVAQASVGCTAVNGGTFNGTLVPNAAGNSGPARNPGTFTPGDVVRFTWTGMSSLLIQHNGANVHTTALANGSFDVTITGPNDTLRWSGLAGGAGATMTVTCLGAGVPPAPPTPPTPPPPPTLTGVAEMFSTQNTGSGVVALEGDQAFGDIVNELRDAFTANCAALKLRLQRLERRLQYLEIELDDEQYSDHETHVILTGMLINIAGEAPFLTFEKIQHLIRDDIEEVEDQIEDVERELAACAAMGLNYFGASASSRSAALDAFDSLLGRNSTPLDAMSWSVGLAPMAYTGLAGDGVVEATARGWSMWTSGSISGLNSTGANSFSGASGRIDFGALRPLGDNFSLGGFVGWDGGNTANATTGGTTSGNAIHFGIFGNYRLPSDIVLAISGGAAFGALSSTIGADTGTTGTQRGFLSGSIGGTIWEGGPWTLAASGSAFVGVEQQNAFTTNNGVAVPAQTITKSSASANTTITYALPTEVPAEVFATLGLSLSGGTTTPNVSGSIGSGVKVTLERLQASVSANFGGLGSTMRSWSLSGTLGASF